MTGFSLCLFGGFEARLDDEPITQFRSDKIRALLAYLAVESGHPHRREALAGLLWPDWPERKARRNLSNSLSRLRRSLGQDFSHQLLTVTRSTIKLNTEHLWLDAAEFQRLVAACEAHKHEALHACDGCIERLTRAVELYRGEFMAGFTLSDALEYGEWLFAQREKHHSQLLTLLYNLADAPEKRGDYRQAQTYAERQIQLEPWREPAHRQLMRVYARSGQRTAALAQYAACRQILADELGVEPSAKTQALYEQIRDEGAREKGKKGKKGKRSPCHPFSPYPYHPLSPSQSAGATHFVCRARGGARPGRPAPQPSRVSAGDHRGAGRDW